MLTMVFVLPSTVSLFLLSWTLPYAHATSPPRDVELIYPASAVNLNQTVDLGWASTNDSASLLGFTQNVTVSVTFPNGTNRPVIDSQSPNNSTCVGSTGFATGSFIADQIGTYIAYWNYSYGISSDSSQVNSTYCGPPPFSFQSWLLNHTFDAQTLGSNVVALNTTASSNLPTQPTGSVKSTNGGTRLKDNTLMGMGAIVIALFGLPFLL